MGRSMPGTTIEEKLLLNREIDDEGCWLWTRSRDQHGYGRLRISRTFVEKVYRLAYELWVGPIPDGLEIDHLCRKPPCFNPTHLEAVTHGVNLVRARAAMTHCLRGHPFTSENTYVSARGSRNCRTCRRLYDAEYRARKRRERDGDA